MQDNNLLLQDEFVDGSYQLRLKIKYLEQEKQKLEIVCKQMAQNIKLLRNINKELSKQNGLVQQNKQQNNLIKMLQEQATTIESAYLRALQESNSLSCQKLMLQQIIQESQKEYTEILKGYEIKIIQLRRSIQFKESCIQTFQQNKNYPNNGYQIGNIPPSNISMVFFNQIDEYKTSIQQLKDKNKQLQIQLNHSTSVIQKLNGEKTQIDKILASRCSYNEFRERYIQQILNKKIIMKSQPKQILLHKWKVQSFPQSKINSNKKQIKQNIAKQKSNLTSTQSHQTRQTSYQCTSGNFKLNQMKQELKKINLENSKLGSLYRKQKKLRKQNQQKLKILISSNKFYKEKRQNHFEQLNYYKKATVDLTRLIQKKKVKRNYSLDKNQTQKIIANVKKPSEVEVVQCKKKLWKKIQEQIHVLVSNKNMFQLAKPKNSLKRSLSSILDYTQLCHDDDKIDKYYLKVTPKQQRNLISKINPYSKPQNLQDFSRVLQLGTNGQIFDDQTLIIKPKVMSYAQRKKIKNHRNFADANNLTIIRQNLL